MLEQYDFIIYGTASALIFSKVFFPTISPAAGLIAAFSAYAVGFAARPLGGLFFSHLGEKYGRKWVLVSTLFLMGAATFLIGCLPMFGTRYRYAGVTLGREFSSIIGGGVAPLVAAALMAAFANSWVPKGLAMRPSVVTLGETMVRLALPEENPCPRS